MGDLTFGSPKLLPPAPSSIEIELPYKVQESTHIIKVSVSDTLVEKWLAKNENILEEMEKYALDYINDKLEKANLQEHELLILK